MNLDANVADLIVKLGVAAPLVMIMWLMLKERSKELVAASDERRAMTERHIAAIERMTEKNVDALLRTASTLDKLSEAVQEGRHQSTTEHMELLRAMRGEQTK